MNKMVVLLYKIVRKSINNLCLIVEKIVVKLKFIGNGVNFKDFRSSGIPYVSVATGAICKIGYGFAMNNNLKGNPIGCPQPCILFVDHGAELIIGNNVGISSTAIVAHKKITICDNVKIGGGVVIYDTDFHSLNAQHRINIDFDKKNIISRPVTINKNVFVGAHSIILKGVTIGENSIIGAGAVVTKSIPQNQLWAGNPAKFIRNI